MADSRLVGKAMEGGEVDMVVGCGLWVMGMRYEDQSGMCLTKMSVISRLNFS